MPDQIDRLRMALLAAATQFAKYAAYHLAKQPPDHEKASINIDWSLKCLAAAGVDDDA